MTGSRPHAGGPPPENPAALVPHRVFLVEDHPVMREALSILLRREADIELVGAAASAEEAFGALDGAPCDLVVTNVSLPGMDGVALAERLRWRRPELAVVVISADDEDGVARRAVAAGAHAFLGKRDLVATLPGVIREALGDRGTK